MTKQQFNIQFFETILPNDIREELNYDLTVSLKSIIEQKGLVKSGWMFDITEVKVSVNKTIGTFRVSIQTSDYYKYLDENYNLTQSFINSRAYKNALKVFKELSNSQYDEYLNINKELKNKYV